MPVPANLAEAIGHVRTRPRPGRSKELSMAEAARRTGLWASPAISTSYWAQVERGDGTPTAPVLLRMALACDATPEEIHDVFHTAGYGHLHDTLAALGPTPETLPDTAEAGILADPRLPYDKRLTLLDHLSDTLDALQTRLRRVAGEDLGVPPSPGPDKPRSS